MYLSVAHIAWAALAAALLVVGLNRFFFPSRFEIDRDGITARYPLRQMHLPWDRIRRMNFDEYGGYLSDHAEPSRRDAWRGMHLLFDDGTREEAIANIRAFAASRGDGKSLELESGDVSRAKREPAKGDA